jgi:hypothetical protein
MMKKYTSSYFMNFISMLQSNYADKRGRVELSEDNINDLILMYVYTEGEEEFHKLKAEVKEIVEQKDLQLFVKTEIKNVKELEFISSTILKHH